MNKIKEIIAGLSLPEDRKQYYLEKFAAEGEAPSIMQELMLEHNKWIEEELIRIGAIDPESEQYKQAKLELQADLEAALEELKTNMTEVEKSIDQIASDLNQEEDSGAASEILNKIKAE
ncbi:hypothetical protein CO057_00125 [Candidatus Uhrbacteria bacterium CG_4_9_14_0_2_um_filter_41_50]|uniref:Uncharacterized protein n=1 Tax=Candidatus Uhrbacteria bacterium CG_4_9_14_0_2_um_filter_41_50 TaxID=1975031 RepID=A0A2M8EQD2_9BACT|nr:MAG: hypothetical protein COZ45_03270 [Candidatus Uhrbacteria bacterium CG_4_10_14_3_um_filter_41_21]PIZ55495.1 MAG: hypothetical protein COY24_00140 [Candidatus Uhrbacteria bacterium CG_4_10_14_0_2_um_filter_41_21]PJB84699.1 MAG: hypothetical protein CO086_02310 [Candidatus Uhrbacteria bacterium CG_4_9_14_0_8_um_filter_41_16]PJC24944.1 MAG: hypothetical protein CO057_00125 [Candidatus Uhrbacteria bacterium CG_4_9_14_0_2_um_filter_41_50]PJE74680.1 MAG: hypothetical protein COV03_04135 [Candi